jgi:hypothetical protein
VIFRNIGTIAGRPGSSATLRGVALYRAMIPPAPRSLLIEGCPEGPCSRDNALEPVMHFAPFRKVRACGISGLTISSYIGNLRQLQGLVLSNYDCRAPCPAGRAGRHQCGRGRVSDGMSYSTSRLSSKSCQEGNPCTRANPSNHVRRQLLSPARCQQRVPQPSFIRPSVPQCTNQSTAVPRWTVAA